MARCSTRRTTRWCRTSSSRRRPEPAAGLIYYAVWATDAPGMLAERLRVRDAHRARLRAPQPHPVKVVAGGATLDEADGAMNGTLLVVEADSIDVVRRFVDADPYVLAGVYARVEVRPWQWGLGPPAPSQAG